MKKDLIECQQDGCFNIRAEFAMVEMPHIDTGNVWCRECVGWYIFDTLLEIKEQRKEVPAYESR
jgi:hypothetical protein